MTAGQQTWWLSSRRMTVLVVVDDRGIITDAAPIVRRFRGQRIKDLRGWMHRQGGLRVERLA